MYRFLPILPDTLALGWGLLLGKDEDFSKEMKLKTRAAGVSHLTAASGANIQLVQSLSTPLTSWFWWWWLGRGLLIPFYVVASGLSGSLWRASFQAMYLLLGQAFGRPVSIWFSLGLVFLVAPQAGWQSDLGFLLSWLALVGLSVSQHFSSGEKQTVLSPHVPTLYKNFVKSSISGSVILLCLAPVLISNFGEWQPHGLLSTMGSQPVTSLFTYLFVGHLLFGESNKVAQKLIDVSGFWSQVSELVALFLGLGKYLSSLILSLLFGYLWWVWEVSISLPSILSWGLILLSCLLFLRQVLKSVLNRYLEYRDSRLWGWRV